MFMLFLCKRDEYIRAWLEMYKKDKKVWNDPMFDGINPALNKTPLKTEIDNICAVIYDTNKHGDTERGMPVGIFSMVITDNKIIGKQFVVHPKYQGKGLGKALVLSLEQYLHNKKYTWYYIGCSHMSAGIMRSFGAKSYEDDNEHDLYKFRIDLTRASLKEQFDKYVARNKNLLISYSENL